MLVFIHNSNPILGNTFLNVFSEYSWFGVDLFFCLSAFLITRLLVTEYQLSGKINVKNFYIRRILRIWPLYFFYVAVILSLAIQSDGWSSLILKHIVGLATFTFNFVYFALLPSPVLLVLHLWSISYEEQFYAVIPWILRGLAKATAKSKWLFLAIFILLGNSIRALFIYLQLPHPAIYNFPFTHFESILGGIAIGLGLLDKPLGKLRGWILFLLGVLLLSMITLLPNNDVTGWGLMLTYPLVGIGMALIVFSAVNDQHLFLIGFLKNKVIAYLGKISYGLYVFHFGSLALASRICLYILRLTFLQPIYIVLTLILGLSLTILFSVISYQVIEKPFLSLKKRFGLIASHPI